MRFPSKNPRKIVLSLCILSSIVSAVGGMLYLAVLVQYPPARTDWSFIGRTVFLFSVFVCSFWAVTKFLETKIAKDTYYFVSIVVTFSLIVLLLGNIGLKLNLSFEQIVAISILISTPVSCIVAGYSKKTLVARLKKLGLDQGVTLFAILLLALVPIINYPFTFSISFRQSGYVLPNLTFQTTPNTTIVKGEINGSAFLVDIPVTRNQTFQADRFVDINVTNWANESLTFQFFVSNFKGSFVSLKELELVVMSSSDSVKVFFIDNEDILQCNQASLLLQTHDRLSFSVRLSAKDQVVQSTNSSISVSVADHDTILKTVSITLVANRLLK